MNRRTAILVSTILTAFILAGWAASQPPTAPEIDAELVGLRAGSSDDGFARALESRTFQFPADHGPHPEYRTEWWYYTGNLETDAGRAIDGAQYRHFDGAQYRHFGYQLTFFRQALMPTAPERDSEWGTNQVYMAHFAVTDVAGGRFHNFERFSRGSAGLAGATGTPYHVWLESWLVEETSPGVVRLQASEGDVKLDLTLQPLKPPALHGQAGLSQKSSTPGNASYYYSQTRIETTGSVTVGGQSYAVRGSSWMDHEFGTSFLADNQVGWDWFSLQLDDGRELMFFQIRQDDGGIEPLSGGSLIDADGTVRHLNREDVIIQVLDRWTSPKTGAVYPAGWHLSVPLAGLELDIQPYAGDQELTVSYTYWEGGVQVTGQGANGPISGNGYVELMGYVAQLIVPNS